MGIIIPTFTKYHDKLYLVNGNYYSTQGSYNTIIPGVLVHYNYQVSWDITQLSSTIGFHQAARWTRCRPSGARAWDNAGIACRWRVDVWTSGWSFLGAEKDWNNN